MPAGAILSSDLADGGSGYVVNDTGEVTQGISNHSATYQILSVDGFGAVLTYTLTDQGNSYVLASEVATQPDGGAGAGFAIDILVVEGGGGGSSGYINRIFGG